MEKGVETSEYEVWESAWKEKNSQERGETRKYAVKILCPGAVVYGD